MVIQVFIGYCSTTLANNYSFISHNDYISLNILGASGNFISRPHLYNSAQLYSTTFSRTLQSSTEDASCRSQAELACFCLHRPSLFIRMYNYLVNPPKSCLGCCTSLGLHPSSPVFDSNPSVSCRRAEAGFPNNSCVQCYIRILYEFGMVLEFGPNCVYIQVRIHTH